MTALADAPGALRPKALAILRTGRLTVIDVSTHRSGGRADEVIARVMSSRQGGPTYAVDLMSDRWTCTCRAGGHCPHELAVRMVTGHAPQAEAVTP